MRSSKRLLIPLLTLAAIGLMTACSNNPTNPTDGGTDAGVDAGPVACKLGQANCCVRSKDCADLSTATNVAACNTGTGTCYLTCNASSDCPNLDPTNCGNGQCVCDTGTCTLPACSSNADCNGTGQCIGGACGSGEASPDGCVIAPTPVYTHDGSTVALTAYATKGGTYVVPSGSFTWSSDTPSVASVDSATGVVTGGGTSGTATITATIGSASCPVDVTNYVAPAATDVSVLVLDENTRQPVQGAEVVVRAAGADVGEGTTLADGTTTVSNVTAATIDVHVFTPDTGYADAPNGYEYVSVIGTTKKDLVFYLPRNGAPNVAGGYQGTLTPDDFAKLGTDDVHVALAGASLPGNFMDLDLNILIGEMIQTHVKFGSLIDQDIGLPSGLVIGIGTDMFKDKYQPLAVPGLRTGWALGGNLPLAQVTQVLAPIVSGGGGTSNIPVGQLVGQLLPLFTKFYSSVTPGLQLSEYPRVADANGNMIPDFSQFPQYPVDLNTKMKLDATVDIPTLPKVGGSYLDGAIVLGGVSVAGQGLVPLGLTAGTDVSDPNADQPNGIVNDTGDTPNPGKVTLRLAPEHGGIEGSNYVLLSIALGFSSLGGSSGGVKALSGFVKEVPSISYVTDQNGNLVPPEIGFGATDYMPFAEGAALDSTTRTYTPASVAGADFYRLSLTDTNGHGWLVYHGSASGTIVLPDPATYTCGAGQCGDRVAAGETADAQAVMTKAGTTVDQLFEFNDTNLDTLGDLTKGFSNVGITVN